MEQRTDTIQIPKVTSYKEERLEQAGPFDIPNILIWNAFKQVKKNKGTAEIDKGSVLYFRGDERKRLWSAIHSDSDRRDSPDDVKITTRA